MADLMEITELDLNDGFRSSSNFGGGLELLMNDKVKDSYKSSDIDLDDLNRLENELNDLVEEVPSSNYAPKSDLFDTKPSVSFDDKPMNLNLGRSTVDMEDNATKTWDGYGKYNNISVNPDMNIPLEPKMSKEETLREKFKYLRKLESLEKKGVELSKKYSMESSLTEMIGEYETIMDEKSRQNSIKFQGNVMMAVVNGIEYLNNKFDPFDIKLDGWSEQVQENLSDYDDIFAELHEKYKSKASMSPELKLLFQLGGSAAMLHITNSMFKNAMPGMDDLFRQNPDLMRSFQTATINSMAQTNPGFSGFMSNVMGSEAKSVPGMGPPPPVATQGPNAVPPPVGRPGNNNFARPDLNYSKNFEDGIHLRESADHEMSSRRPASTQRPDMKGPSDITDILSGIKTKTINIQPSVPNQNDSSTISINDLKELQSDANIPKRSGRKRKSDKNTVSLDI